MNAAGPWMWTYEVPEDVSHSCLLRVRHFKNSEWRLFLTKYARGHWVFPDRSWLINEYEVNHCAVVMVPAAT